MINRVLALSSGRLGNSVEGAKVPSGSSGGLPGLTPVQVDPGGRRPVGRTARGPSVTKRLWPQRPTSPDECAISGERSVENQIFDHKQGFSSPVVAREGRGG